MVIMIPQFTFHIWIRQAQDLYTDCIVIILMLKLTSDSESKYYQRGQLILSEGQEHGNIAK